MAETGAAAYWCTRGGLFTLVHARNPGTAIKKASRAMRRPAEGISARPAKPADLAVWADLLAQDAAGVEGCRRDRAESVQASLFAA